MKINWTTDGAGLMRGFSYHDCSLAGLEWAESRYFRMKLLTSSGVNVVELVGIDTLTFRLWDGAIVSEIFAWPVSAVPETVWKMSDGAWHALLAERTRPSEEREAAARIVKRRPSAFLVQVLTSYGGMIAVVCDLINVSTETA